MRLSLPIKLMASYLLVAGLIAGPSMWRLRSALFASLQGRDAQETRGQVEELQARLSTLSDDALDAAARDAAKLLRLRVSVIRADGVVLSDSAIEPAAMASLSNHADRPEVKMALAGRYGSAARASTTVGQDLVYGALPLLGSTPPRAVVRIARPAAPVRAAIAEAMRAQRLSIGLGLSAAIGLCFLAAVSISSPLRKMRDAARSFSQARGGRVERARSGDEIEDLSTALDDLGAKIGAQLVEVGAQDALLAQAVRALPSPAVVLTPSLEPLHVNGALRRFAGTSAANEAGRLAELLSGPELANAVIEAERSGLPTELTLLLAAGDAGSPALTAHKPRSVHALLVPLYRPGTPPLWLLLIDTDKAPSENTSSLHQMIHRADLLVARLWAHLSPDHREARSDAAQLQHRLDLMAEAAGAASAWSVEVTPAGGLIEACVEQMRARFPEASLQLSYAHDDVRECTVADAGGNGGRALRALIAGSVTAGRPLQISVEVQPGQVVTTVDGAAPLDLHAVQRFARALGGEVGRIAGREKEAAWLSLPRA